LGLTLGEHGCESRVLFGEQVGGGSVVHDYLLIRSPSRRGCGKIVSLL
jgi:hypothetical protein